MLQILYNIVIGLALLAGTVICWKTVKCLPEYRKPLYWLKTVTGATWVVTFAVGSLHYIDITPPGKSVLYLLEFAIFLTALQLIASPIADRYELKKLGSPAAPVRG